jgi:hypothetical protein
MVVLILKKIQRIGTSNGFFIMKYLTKKIKINNSFKIQKNFKIQKKKKHKENKTPKTQKKKGDKIYFQHVEFLILS